VSGDSSLFLVLLVGSVGLLTLAWGVLSRRALSTVPDAQERPRPESRLAAVVGILPSLLCAFLCAVGAIWLLPWAAVLPSMRAPGLVSGMPFIALLSVGMLYALKGRGGAE
jgi:hypothetical protein